MKRQDSPEFPHADDLLFLSNCRDGENEGDGSQLARCFLCSQAIAVDATVCCYCGMELTSDPRDALAQRRNIVLQRIENLERGFSLYESDMMELTGHEWFANRLVRASRNLIFIGLVLAPLLVGVPVMVTGAAIQHASIKASKEARRKRLDLEQYDEASRYWHIDDLQELAGIEAAMERLERGSR
jgi:hypothetical protein